MALLHLQKSNNTEKQICISAPAASLAVVGLAHTPRKKLRQEAGSPTLAWLLVHVWDRSIQVWYPGEAWSGEGMTPQHWQPVKVTDFLLPEKILTLQKVVGSDILNESSVFVWRNKRLFSERCLKKNWGQKNKKLVNEDDEEEALAMFTPLKI